MDATSAGPGTHRIVVGWGERPCASGRDGDRFDRGSHSFETPRERARTRCRGSKGRQMALALSNVLRSGCTLQLKRVMTREGHEVGRVFDVQCRRSADGARIEIVALVYGKRGLLERLGVRAHCDTVAWEEVAEVTEE